MKTNFANRQIKASSVLTAKLQGFTILELMIALLISAILMAIAVPSFTRIIRDNRVLSGANSLVGAIGQARSEALRRSRSVTVCPSVNGTTCSGSDWPGGWIVVLEKTSVGTGGASDPDGTAVPPNGVLITGSKVKDTASTRTAGSKDWVRFTARGMVEEVLTLQLKPSTCNTGTPFQELTIGIAGRVSLVKKKC